MMKSRRGISDFRLMRLIADQQIKESKDKKKKGEETSHKQQILILHYLGILDQYNITTSKKGVLFSKLLNRNDKNTEDYIRYVAGKVDKNPIKTRKNLEFVYNFFKELEMPELADKVKIDIDKMKEE